MKSFAGFEYPGLDNIGDNIQSFATERLLPTIEQRFDRDTLAYAKPEREMHIVMNGWFSHSPQTCLPLSEKLHPVFWGFHITDWNDSWHYFSRRRIVDYLKAHEPIGCRDPYTAQRLSDLGIKAFVSYCLTLTLPRREKEPINGKTIVVDVPSALLPTEISKHAEFITHRFPASIKDENEKRLFTKEFLHYYETQAALVITSRLHCLLPCIAMNIPVLFFGNNDDYRISWVKDLGVKIHSKDEAGNIDWSPNALEWESRKEEMVDKFKNIILNRL